MSNFTFVCDPSRYVNLGLDISSFRFCNSSLSFPERSKDLVDRMTLSEKVAQLGHRALGVARLGLPPYNWWSEALHGVSNVGPGTRFDDVVPGATSFPNVISMAASFSEAMWKTIGQVVSTEARAMYNLGRAGLTYWSPNVNVVRDPRWGRTLETPGEDPFVVGKYAVNYVRGLQDVEGTENATDLNSRPLKVSSCCKHYAAYDVDNWLGVERYTFDAKVTEQDMLETFLKPFEMCVKEGDVSSVMCSYNKVHGLPTCADPALLKDTIRGDWDLHGYIVSDCDSIEVMVDHQHFLQDTNEDAVAQTLKAGLDLDCGQFYPNFTEDSVRQGKVGVKNIDKSLNYLYVVLMRLGFFDGSPEFQSLGSRDICNDEHIELATESARQGMVLLKNDNDTLPLDTSTIKTLAVVGPHANATSVMLGNYAGVPCRVKSPIDGLSGYAKVNYQMGCENVACRNDTFIFGAMDAAKNSDATVILGGIDLSIEAESLDRVDLLLPGFQTQLIQQVAAVSKGPVVLVIMSAGGIDISFAKNSPNIKAIVWAGYPGEEGGRAIADVIFGKFNPGGRLPVTWYEADYVNQLPMTSMPLRPVKSLGYPGRTYKFYDGTVVYPFGYGLSYTSFTHTLVSASRSLAVNLDKTIQCRDMSYEDTAFKPDCAAVLVDDLTCSEEFEFEIKVENTGKKDGSQVVIVYSKPPSGISSTHIKQVVGFQRVFVDAGGNESVKFKLNACKSLGLIDFSGYNLLPAGGHTIVVGDGDVSFPVQLSFHGN
ncbi:probable beta-D-xylosidase 5 [Cucurbita pepo subsp. pepo]|uniref:probable beta-D-xylosidase 5 n=1 Tax=Cucurbita pepo subsp. pepo TaxID=3664 RepID=UPI000C9D7DB2|nr:probable beta-D-xylosidase 5 [Cucurbita pepo subsp. pepo]